VSSSPATLRSSSQHPSEHQSQLVVRDVIDEAVEVVALGFV
jgi:hypothetical protein